MARFFKFKTAADLEAEARRLDVPIILSDDYSALWQPAAIAGRMVGNRLCIQPMEGCDGTTGGDPDELTFRRFARFGGGGAKLIWGEATAVAADGRANPRQLCIRDDNVGLFALLVETCRKAHRAAVGADGDLLIGLQLTHSGRYSCTRPVLALHCATVDARTIVDPATGKTADESYPLITDDELLRLRDAYLAAARLAHRAGFDFVDLKQCHRYLLSELLAAKTRPGRFGGPLEHRAALVLGIVEQIRRELPGLIVATRLNVFDGVPFVKGPDSAGTPANVALPFRTGFGVDENDPARPDLAEPIQLIALLRAAGVSLVNVTMGCPYYNPHLLRPAEQPPIDGYDAPEHPLVGVGRHFQLTAEIQSRFPDLALVGSGYSYLQDYLFDAVAANVAGRKTTFAGIGRAALAYPNAALDLARNGALDRKSICRTFSYCTNLMRSKNHPLGQFPTGCPPFDRAVYGAIWEESKIKN